MTNGMKFIGLLQFYNRWGLGRVRFFLVKIRRTTFFKVVHPSLFSKGEMRVVNKWPPHIQDAILCACLSQGWLASLSPEMKDE